MLDNQNPTKIYINKKYLKIHLNVNSVNKYTIGIKT